MAIQKVTSDGRKEIRIGLLGSGFMGKCHTNAYRKIPYIYADAGVLPRLLILCDQNDQIVEREAARYGYEQFTTDWNEMVRDVRIDEGEGREIPMVIVGDFNSRPGDEAMSQYEAAGFVYVKDSAGQILDEIDHIMYRPRERWRVVEADKPTHYTASDHDPVWAILELLNPNATGKQEPGHRPSGVIR